MCLVIQFPNIVPNWNGFQILIGLFSNYLISVNFLLMDLAQELKRYRKKKGHTMADIEALTGIPAENLYKWEKGTKPSDAEQLLKLRDYLAGKLETVPYLSTTSSKPQKLETPAHRNNSSAKKEGKETPLMASDPILTKYITLLEKENEHKREIIETNLTGLVIGQKSILAHLAVSLEGDALRDAGGDKRKADQLKESMDKRIGEVFLGRNKVSGKIGSK